MSQKNFLGGDIPIFTQGLLLVLYSEGTPDVQAPYGVLGIKPRPVSHKRRALPTVMVIPASRFTNHTFKFKKRSWKKMN